MNAKEPAAPTLPIDPSPAAPQGVKAAGQGAAQLVVELGPVLAFMISYNVLRGWPAEHAFFAATGFGPADAIYVATGVFMAATTLAIAYSWMRTRSVPPVLLVMGVLIVGFGGLTIAFKDPTFIKVKPTIVNIFYAAAIFISLAIKQNVWKLLFRHAFTLPDKIWDILALRWGVFFVFMAGLNEAIWRTQSEAFWVNSRFWLVFPLVLVFMLANLPLTLKHAGKTEIEPSVR